MFEGLFNKREEKPKREEIDLGRRGFFRDALMLLGAGVLAGLPLLKNEKHQERSEFDFEELPFPDNVPELVGNYRQKFIESGEYWPGVVEDQRKKVIGFLRSDFYKNALTREFAQYFAEKSISKDEEEIREIVSKNIEDRVEKVLKAKIKYRVLDKDMGNYDSFSNTVNLDTLQERFDVEFGHIVPIDLFVPSHEFWHVTQQGVDTYASSYNLMFDMLEKNGVFNAYDRRVIQRIRDFPKEREKVNVKYNITEEWKKLKYFHRITEIIPLIMHIRTTYHTVCETSGKIAEENSYNMYEDTFTQKHLEFMKANQGKVFMDFGTPSTGKVNTILQKLLDVFTEEQFVELMNRAI